jgi:uncharacterized linocin/CFP29 family protein
MANGNNSLNWDSDRWQRLNAVVHDEAAKIRVGRRLVPLFGNSSGYMDNIIGHAVNVIAGPRPVLSIPNGQTLVPVEVSVDFRLTPEQFADEQVATALAIRAAYLVALAEDAVVLHGAQANVGQFSASERNLLQQTGLFQANQPQVGQPILQSILAGIAALRQNNHHGPYCVIVAPDLYQEAFTPLQRVIDAPIYEIRPLLQEDGFQYSPAAPQRTGVVFSLGGHTLDMAVPVDAMAELDDEERGAARLRVVEQFRLRVNDPTAVVPLA